MSVISGASGAVDGASGTQNWSITSSKDIQTFVSSATKGGTGRLAGNGDWSGRYSAFGHTPAVMPGDTFTFTGSIDGTNGATGDARVDRVEITIDIEGGKIIGHTVDFSSNGDLTLGAAVATDTAAQCPPSAIGCRVAMSTALAAAGSATFADIDDVRTISITLTADNKAYRSSSTNGGTMRTKGTFDATFSFSVYTDDFSTLPAPGITRVFRFYVSATTFWQFEWGMVGELSDLAVDIENKNPIGATVNGGMTGVATIATVCTYGTIKNPAGNTVWPAA
jgi:hypothetical protein